MVDKNQIISDKRIANLLKARKIRTIHDWFKDRGIQPIYKQGGLRFYLYDDIGKLFIPEIDIREIIEKVNRIIYDVINDKILSYESSELMPKGDMNYFERKKEFSYWHNIPEITLDYQNIEYFKVGIGKGYNLIPLYEIRKITNKNYKKKKIFFFQNFTGKPLPKPGQQPFPCNKIIIDRKTVKKYLDFLSKNNLEVVSEQISTDPLTIQYLIKSTKPQ